MSKMAPDKAHLKKKIVCVRKDKNAVKSPKIKETAQFTGLLSAPHKMYIACNQNLVNSY